ncbi:MAG: cupin domain-containing protein [Actinophytocola sp.]|uniref:cupin domain-containing protein n=1 Tax=Actinophytocola sp. TaxID=1872138 RepID=UPI003C788BCC
MVVRRGEVYENPACGERVVIRVGNDVTNGERILWDLYLEPGGAVVGEHYHPSIEERFTLLEGKLGVRLAGRTQIVDRIGASVLAPANTPHYWWNASDEPARILVEVRGASERFEQMVFRQLFSLAQDGSTNAEGMPNLWQTAVTALEFEDVMRFSKPPWFLQRLIFKVLSPIARLRGYEGYYAKYQDRKPSGMAEPEALPPGVIVDE